MFPLISIDSDNYITTLGPEMQKKAQDELGESELLTKTSLIAVRDWIKKQPHLFSSMITSKY